MNTNRAFATRRKQQMRKNRKRVQKILRCTEWGKRKGKKKGRIEVGMEETGNGLGIKRRRPGENIGGGRLDSMRRQKSKGNQNGVPCSVWCNRDRGNDGPRTKPWNAGGVQAFADAGVCRPWAALDPRQGTPLCRDR